MSISPVENHVPRREMQVLFLYLNMFQGSPSCLFYIQYFKLTCLLEVRVVDNAACLTPTENNFPNTEVNVLTPLYEYQVLFE